MIGIFLRLRSQALAPVALVTLAALAAACGGDTGDEPVPSSVGHITASDDLADDDLASAENQVATDGGANDEITSALRVVTPTPEEVRKMARGSGFEIVSDMPIPAVITIKKFEATTSPGTATTASAFTGGCPGTGRERDFEKRDIQPAWITRAGILITAPDTVPPQVLATGSVKFDKETLSFGELPDVVFYAPENNGRVHVQAFVHGTAPGFVPSDKFPDHTLALAYAFIDGITPGTIVTDLKIPLNMYAAINVAGVEGELVWECP